MSDDEILGFSRSVSEFQQVVFEPILKSGPPPPNCPEVVESFNPHQLACRFPASLFGSTKGRRFFAQDEEEKKAARAALVAEDGKVAKWLRVLDRCGTAFLGLG